MKIKYLLVVITTIICTVGRVSAYVDEDGNQSETFIVDYATGERTYVDFETDDEFYDLIRAKLIAECHYEYDDGGVTVEWILKNGLFTNYNPKHRAVNTFRSDTYYWWDRTGMLGIFALNPWGLIDITGDNDTFMVPARLDSFYMNEGFKFPKANVEFIEIERADIGSYRLWSSGGYYHLGQFNSWGNVKPTGAEYYPSPIFQILRDYPASKDNDILSIALYFGQYRIEDWDLKAVTRLKYHVSNVTYIPPKFTQVEEPENEEDVNTDSDTLHYYNLQGMEITTPENGNICIERKGNTARKILRK